MARPKTAKKLTKKVVKEVVESIEKLQNDLNIKQERFCQLYSTDREFFGNGVDSYVEAYNPDCSKPNWYKTAAASASRLLKNVKVIDRINTILADTGFSDEFVDKQLSFLIAQHASFDTKLGAIKEYNKLRQRIIERHEVNVSEMTYDKAKSIIAGRKVSH